MELDPQAKAIVDRANASDAPSMMDSTPEQVRKMMGAVLKMYGWEGPDMDKVEDIQIPGPEGGNITCRVFTPKGVPENAPVLVYFHGSGWVIGGLDSHENEARHYADGAGCIVVVPDYRLAPENKFPAAAEDCCAVLSWVAYNAAQLGGNPDNIAIAGDSAGGNLTAAVSQMALRRGGPSLVYQILVYPVCDTHHHWDSYKRNNEGYYLTTAAMAWFREQYLSSEEDREDYRASPVLGDQLSGLPPALVMTAGFDPLCDEAEAYANRMREAGVNVEYLCYENQIHGFVSFAGAIDDGKEFIKRACLALRQAFAS
jgi:acetyl esterase